MSLPDRLSTLSNTGGERGGGTEQRRNSDTSDVPGTPTAEKQLVQRCVIIQKDERGYGLTVSGDNPVYVASVKPEGAAAKAGVQKDDRIIKVNGTLVLNKNHIDVVKLIKSGSFVALTLMGKPNPSGNTQGSVSPQLAEVNHTPSSGSTHITPPQPVDPDKDKQLLQEKVHLTRAMLDQAREEFENHQRQYVKTPSEKLHTQLLDKERTVKTLENRLRGLTGTEEPATPCFSQGSQRFLEFDSSSVDPAPSSIWGRHPPKHIKQVSVPASMSCTDDAGNVRLNAVIMRSQSDAASRRPKKRLGHMQSTFYVGPLAGLGANTPGEGAGRFLRHKLKRTTSLPVTDTGSMSDSPHTSPSVSPTPFHGRQDAEESMYTDLGSDSLKAGDSMPMQPEIITIDDEDINSDDEQSVDTGPFSDMRLLEKKPAHMAVLLHYLISNSDPCALFFYIVTDTFKQTAGNYKELRKWGYEIFSTFLAGPSAPLHVEVSEPLMVHVSEVLAAGGNRAENETALRNMFDPCRADLSAELSEQLADFRNKRDLGLGNIFGTHELRENMDRNTELKMVEKYLMPHLQRCTEEGSGRRPTDKDQAMGWALATFFRQLGVSKASSSGILERVQSFIMKDKRGFKLVSRSAKAKAVKGHQFNLQHFYVSTQCTKCEGLIWGVGYQGFLCQSCEMAVHKQCVEDVTETCSGKKRPKRTPLPTGPAALRKPSNSSISSVMEVPNSEKENRSPPHTIPEGPGSVTVQPLRKGDNKELANLPSEQSVRSIVNHYQELASPSEDGEVKDGSDRMGSRDLNRSESLKGKGDKAEPPTRRAKSDVNGDDTIHALNQESGSSSTSSLSNRSVDSRSNSSEQVNEVPQAATRTQQLDPDLEVESELPSVRKVLGDKLWRNLKSEEKDRQHVINELLYTERVHMQKLKVLDLLFNKPMLGETGIMQELAYALFPNLDEIISLHAALNKAMIERRSKSPKVEEVGDILLGRFDGEPGELFRKACAVYCQRQSFALEVLRRHRRKDQRVMQFLVETEADKLCKKLELKDLMPCQMQRLTKYPLLIEKLLKNTKKSSQEYRNLERAMECIKNTNSHVNHTVREFENELKLREMQKRLDTRAIDSSTDPNHTEIKKLDLAQHKLVFDGSLVWRLRSHRLIDLHVLLLEDLLVLLQRVDDRLVLKCQSTNQQTIGLDFKYTHSPVLKLQNLLARNVATDKKAFFVINTSDAGPQIYELVAPTQDARKTWCKLINEKADENKKSLSGMMKKFVPAPKDTPSPEPDEITIVRNRIIRPAQAQSSVAEDEGQAAAPGESSTDPVPDRTDPSHSTSSADPQTQLVQPDQVSVSGAVTAQAFPVLSPVERLRRVDEVIEQALQEREEIVSKLLNVHHSDFQRLAQQQQTDSEGQVEEGENENDPMASCVAISSNLIRLITSQSTSFALESQQHAGGDSGSGSDTQAASLTSPHTDTNTSAVAPEGQAQGAAGQDINIPMPVNQLQSIALGMKKALSSLMRVLASKGEERDLLQTELEATKGQLEKLDSVQQIMAQQHPPPSTPQSRPLSYISITSSLSETGEVVDSDPPEEDADSVLNVAHTEELTQDMVQTAEETVQLESQDPPLLATTTPLQSNPDDDDSDSVDGYEGNLPLDGSVTVDTAFASPQPVGEMVAGDQAVIGREPSSEPMTTDLDEGGEDVTPTSSITTLTEAEGERGEGVGSVGMVNEGNSDVQDNAGQGREEESWLSSEQLEHDGENNNCDNQDSELTKPIEI